MAHLLKPDSKYEDVDLDELLGKLTEEELEQLGQELIDPDDSCIPPSDRCRYKTDKGPSGPFDRKKLLDFLETKAKEEADWEEAKPYKKETRGKVFKRKEEPKAQMDDDGTEETEWDDVLTQATEEELVDLAAILGFHGMLNQVQYHQAFVENKEILGGGFKGVAQHQNFKLFDNVAPNETDVDASLKQMKANDPKLETLNLNNIKNISIERLCEFGELLKNNTGLKELHMCNTKANDTVAKAFLESLTDNQTLEVFSIESNYISGGLVVQMLESINKNQTLREFRIANQRPRVLGHQIETRIADLMKRNRKLLKFSIFLEIAAPRVRVEQYLRRNGDALRKKRMGREDEIEPEEEEEVEKKVVKKVESAPAQSSKPQAKEESSSEEEDSDEEDSD